MNPWDPVIESLPGGGLPVAAPIRVRMIEDDPETIWWAHLLAALWALRMTYHRLADPPQAYRTGRVQERAHKAATRLYRGQSDALHRAAVRAASARVGAWDWRIDPLALETGWWAQAARCAHVLAQSYAFHGGVDDLRAILSCDVLREVRIRVECALPPTIARDLLDLATGPAWDLSRADAASGGTTPDGAPPKAPTMEIEG